MYKKKIFFFDTQSGTIKSIKKTVGKNYNVIEMLDYDKKGKSTTQKKEVVLKDYLTTLILSFTITILSVSLSFVLWVGIDIVENNRIDLLFKLFLSFLGIIILKGILEYIHQKYLETLIYKNSIKLEQKLSNINISMLSESFKESNILHRFERIREIVEMNIVIKLNLLYNILSTFLLLCVAEYINGVLFKYIGLALVLLVYVSYISTKKYSKLQKEYHSNSQILKEKVISNTTKGFTENKEQLKIVNNIKILQIEYDTYNRFIITLSNFLIIISGLYLIYLNEIPTGSLVTFISIINMIFINLDNISKSIIDYIEYGYSRNMLTEILEAS